jgi:large subunit ribosomal protein L24
MTIKKNDRVKILSGKDKGKIGKILQVFPDGNRVSVEGLNLLVKHLRPRRQGEKGQRIEFPAPLDLSKVMMVCPKCDKPTRVAMRLPEKGAVGKKVRICKKCKQVID